MNPFLCSAPMFDYYPPEEPVLWQGSGPQIQSFEMSLPETEFFPALEEPLEYYNELPQLLYHFDWFVTHVTFFQFRKISENQKNREKIISGVSRNQVWRVTDESIEMVLSVPSVDAYAMALPLESYTGYLNNSKDHQFQTV